MIFQGLSVARNCLRPETAPLTITGLKKDFCVSSQKRAAILWDKAARV